MSIVVSKNNQNAKRINESKFHLEDNLQEYLINNPEIIPIYKLDSEARLFIAAREFSTNSGPIDALGFDESGNIYIVETKLFKNPDKRKVIAQALDYGASMWRHATNFNEFISQLDTHTKTQFNTNFQEQYQKFFKIEDASSNFEAIKENLDQGVIKFVILMDSLNDRLKDLILYVNQNSKFDIYAVDFEYYKHDEFEIIIPALYGSEIKKSVTTKSTSVRKRWNENDFFAVVDNDRSLVSESQKVAVYKLWDWAKSAGASFNWGTATIYGSFSPVFDALFKRSFVTVAVNGQISINYGHLDDYSESQLILRDLLKKNLNEDIAKIIDVPNNEISHKFPTILADDVVSCVDALILTFNEFINKTRS